MADVRRLIPRPDVVDALALVEKLRAAQHDLYPFHPAVTGFAADLARRLRRHPEVREYPAIGALAWWIRPASIQQLRNHWLHLCSTPGIIRAPRGVVFHIPPTNVDTMFVYSWLLSALVGNANVIRLSPGATEEASPLLVILADAVAEHPMIAATTAIVTYGHDASITAELSGCDMRMIWGGDRTITTIRNVPLAPHATELAFPDRFSFSVFDAITVNGDTDQQLDDLVTGFINDAYLFDQLGCASPRFVVWKGEAEVVAEADRRFYQRLRRRHATRPEHVATSTTLVKLVHVCAHAADGHVTRIDWANNDATIAWINDLRFIPRDSPGGGLFYQTRISELAELVPHIQRRDQTLTYHGISVPELEAFAQRVGARGIDRIVPTGQALIFNNHWDGHDLLHAMSREIFCG